jgi:outer membrane protein TolC
MARERSPELRVARGELDAARARTRQVRSYFLPSITTSGAALWWDSPLEVRLFEDDPCADLEDFLQDYCADMIAQFQEPMLLRERATQQVSVKASQPLNGLWNVAEGHAASRAMERAAEADLDATRARVAVAAVEAWTQAARTRRLADLARQAIRALESHEARARAFQAEGLVGRGDILRLEVALNDARLNLMRAELGQALSEKALAVVIGAEPSRLRPADEALSAPPVAELDPSRIEPLVRAAPATRAMDAKLQAAEAARRRAVAGLLPQLALMGNWTHNWGLGTMSADEEWYVGMGLQWEPWTWGRNVHAVREAEARAAQARAGLEGLGRGAGLEAEAALGQARIAAKAVEAYAKSLEQAEENLRVVSARYEVRTASTADLLEAETLALKARVDHAGGVLDVLVAVARAQAALGLEPRPQEGLGAPQSLVDGPLP